MTREFIANAIKEGITYSHQTGSVVIHGAIEKIITEHEQQMRKLIDLDEETFKTLSKLAIDNDTNLKSYIESVLVLHASGGFKDKKHSNKRKVMKD